MGKNKGKTTKPVNQNILINKVRTILSKISDSKLSDQSDLKVLRDITFNELTHRLFSCHLEIVDKNDYDISDKSESLEGLLSLIDKDTSEGTNLFSWPFKGYFYENATFTEIVESELKHAGMQDIREPQCLVTLMRDCLDLQYFNGNSGFEMTDQEKIEYSIIEYLVTGRAWEALGYWTAKSEEMKRNKKGGGEKMKRRGEDNKEAIKNALAELKIKSLLVFKKDRELRDRFMMKAKEKTKDEHYNLPLSEKRIMDIARNVLKDEGTSLDTKPAA